eukprot:934300_1
MIDPSLSTVLSHVPLPSLYPSLPLVLCLSFGAKSTYRQSSIKLFCDILVNILTHITKHVRLPLIVVHTVQIQHIHSYLHVIVFVMISTGLSWQFDRCPCLLFYHHMFVT